MTVKYFETENKGVSFSHFRLEKNVDSVIAIGSERIILTGKPQFILMKNSKKFGDQIQITVTNNDNNFIIQKRNNDRPIKWDTVEINIQKSDAIEMIKLLNAQLILEKLL